MQRQLRRLIPLTFGLILVRHDPARATTPCDPFLAGTSGAESSAGEIAACLSVLHDRYPDVWSKLQNPDTELPPSTSPEAPQVEGFTAEHLRWALAAMPRTGDAEPRAPDGAGDSDHSPAPASIPVPRLILAPGHWLFSKLHLPPPESGYALAIYTACNLYLWLLGIRLFYWRIGRLCGWGGDDRFFRFFVIPCWRTVVRILFRPVKWARQFTGGKQANARWTGAVERMTMLYKRSQLYIGSISFLGIRFNQPIGFNLKTHVFVCGSSGSGKSTLMSRMAALWERGPVLAIDADGAIVSSLWHRLGSGGNGVFGKGMGIAVLDPYGLSKTIQSVWNIIRQLDRVVERHGAQAVVRYSQTIAEGLIRQDNEGQVYFANSARTFLTSLIIYVWLYEPPSMKNLVRVRDLLTRGLPEMAAKGEDPFKALLRIMKTKMDFDGVIARGAAVMESSQGTDGKNHSKSTAITQTAWLDIPEAADMVRGRGPECESDFYVEDIQAGKTNVFFVAPVGDIREKLSSIARLLLTVTFYTFENIPGKPRHHTLVLADELPSCGRISALETGPATLRKYGLQIVMAAQDITAMAETYPTWSAMIGNAELQLYLATNHKPTLEHLVQILGKRTRKVKVEGSPWWKVWGQRIPSRFQREDRDLMDFTALHQHLNKARGSIIAVREGDRPFRLKNNPHYTLPVYLQEPSQGFGENILREHSRRVFAWLQERSERRKKVRAYKKTLGNETNE